ncbi:MAG: monovalent cation:proton antiporter-2 (CPA2) family protein [Rhodovibrionaceae bacterium]
MEEAHSNIPHLREVVVFLVAAGIVLPIMQRLRINPILGYLTVGAAIGPFGLGLLVPEFPWLRYAVIADIEGVRALAELGVIFLLFMIGLELSFDRLWRMKRLVFGLGGAQVALCGLAIGGLAWAWGNDPASSILLGACLALSSTAIVMQLLIDRRQLGAPVGRASFAILLFQDLAVVPILFLLGVLGGEAEGGMTVFLAVALAKAVGAVAVILLLGRLVVRPVFRLVSAAHSRELFMAVTLLAVVGTAAATGAAGLSMALGAFLAGLLLAETEYRHQIEVDLEPFKGLLLGLFFMSVGMGIDLRAVGDQLGWVLLAVAGLVVLKSVITIGLALAFGLPRATAVETGLLLAQGGEFAFLVVGIATTLEVMPGDLAQFILIVVGLTMMATPPGAVLARRAGSWLAGREASKPGNGGLEELAETQGHVIIAGYGRVGGLLGEILDQEQIPSVSLDLDAEAVARHCKAGAPVYYGDATRPEILRRAGAERALALVLTMDSSEAASRAARAARRHWPDLQVYARARDAAHARILLEAGADLAIPENLEVSLQMAEEVLQGLGVTSEAARQTIAVRRAEEVHGRGAAAGRKAGE